jgi:glycosyltransferase involved in cell wall biosynthesis
MKVLHIHDKAPGAGGIGRHVALATEALRQAGLEVATLRIANDPGAESVFPRTYWPHQGVLSRSRFIAQVAAFDPDIVHLHAGFTALAGSLLAALRTKWPVIGTLHDVAPFCMQGDRRFRGTDAACERKAGVGCRTSGCWRLSGPGAPIIELAHLATKARLRSEWLNLDHVVVPSRFMAELAVRHGVERARLHTIPNFTPTTQASDIPKDSEPLVLFVGALTRAKGIDVAVEALARLPKRPWRAAIAGEGPKRAAAEAHVAACGIADRVTFHGACDLDAIERLRAQSTLALFTSRIFESFGLAGLESIAAGRPVVGLANGGAAEWLIDGVTGLTVSRLDPDLLASRVAELLWNRERAVELGEQGRRKVESEFSARTFTRRIVGLYDGALAGSPNAALRSCVAG